MTISLINRIRILIAITLILATIASALSFFGVFRNDKNYKIDFENDSNLFIFFNYLALDLSLSCRYFIILLFEFLKLIIMRTLYFCF